MKHVYYAERIEINGKEFDIMKFNSKLFVNVKNTELKNAPVKIIRPLRIRTSFTTDFSNEFKGLFVHYYNGLIPDKEAANKIVKFYKKNIEEFDKAQYVVDRKLGQQTIDKVRHLKPKK